MKRNYEDKEGIEGKLGNKKASHIISIYGLAFCYLISL